MRIILALCVLFTLNIAKASTYNNTKTIYLQSDTLKKGKNYLLFNKTLNIDNVRFTKNKKSKKTILFITYGFPTPIPSSNTVNATVLQGNRKYKADDALPVFEKIDIINGNYKDIKVEKINAQKSLFTFSGLEFPLHLKLKSGAETIEFKLMEAGQWDIDIELKNN